MSRGRPSKSEIREKITAIMDHLQFSYGYEIYKHYKSIFNDATSRVIYYHLRKGVENGEFVSVNVERVVGNYSWGGESERIYYALGPFAKTKQEWWKKSLGLNLKPTKINYDWSNEIKNKINELRDEVKKNKTNDKKKFVNKCDKLLEWCVTKLKNNSYSDEIENIKQLIK